MKSLKTASCLSASMRTGRFGYATGSIETMEAVSVGEMVSVGCVSGYVVAVSKNEANSSYVLDLLDPATALLDEVQPEAGDGKTILISTLESLGVTATASGNLSSVTVYRPDDPVSWSEWCRTVCLAIGAELFFRNGQYSISPVEMGSVTISDNMVLSASTSSDPSGYANLIVASVNDEWTEPATELETTTETLAGMAVITKKYGDQIVEISQNDSVMDSHYKETWTYDNDGYCTDHSTIESAGDGNEKITTSTFENYTPTDDDNVYSYHIEKKVEEHYYEISDPGAGVPGSTTEFTSSITEISANINLKGVSVIEMNTEEVPDRTAFVWERIPSRKSQTKIFRSESGSGAPEERTVTRSQKYVSRKKWDDVSGDWDETGYWVSGDPTVGAGASILSLIKSPKIKTHSVHLEATAKDPDAITALGEIRKEISATCLDEIEELKALALGELRNSARVRRVQLNIPLSSEGIAPGNKFSWRGEWWRVTSVEIAQKEHTVSVEASALLPLEDLRRVLLGRPDVASSILKAIRSHGKTTTNVNRGKVLSRSGMSRYLIDVGGGRTVRADRGMLPPDRPVALGETVLLAKSSGKEKVWTILERPKEKEIASAVVEEVIKAEKIPIVLSDLVVTPDSTTYPTMGMATWKVSGSLKGIKKYLITAGGTQLEVEPSKVGDAISPSVRVVLPEASSVINVDVTISPGYTKGSKTLSVTKEMTEGIYQGGPTQLLYGVPRIYTDKIGDPYKDIADTYPIKMSFPNMSAITVSQIGIRGFSVKTIHHPDMIPTETIQIFYSQETPLNEIDTVQDVDFNFASDEWRLWTQLVLCFEGKWGTDLTDEGATWTSQWGEVASEPSEATTPVYYLARKIRESSSFSKSINAHADGEYNKHFEHIEGPTSISGSISASASNGEVYCVRQATHGGTTIGACLKTKCGRGSADITSNWGDHFLICKLVIGGFSLTGPDAADVSDNNAIRIGEEGIRDSGAQTSFSGLRWKPQNWARWTEGDPTPPAGDTTYESEGPVIVLSAKTSNGQPYRGLPGNQFSDFTECDGGASSGGGGNASASASFRKADYYRFFKGIIYNPSF